MRLTAEAKTTTNPTVLNRIQRRQLNCSHCPPNRGENAKRRPRNDRYKSHRITRLRDRELTITAS